MKVLACSVSGVALSLCLSPAALAQQVDPARKAAPLPSAGALLTRDTGSSSEIPDIVVTAQRRSERLQDVPIAVSAVTSSMLQARGATSTQDIIAAVPSITLTSTAGYFQPRIRGIGNQAVGPGFEGGVALYIDGVYQASAQSNLFSLANVDRIEVLKGPQGTLFGRNATGGLIQVITRQPQQEFAADINLTAANYQTVIADTYINGGLAEGVAANFTAHVESQGKGWGTNITTGGDAYRTYHDYDLRGSIKLDPGPATSIRLSANYSNSLGNQAEVTSLAPGTGFPFPGLVVPTSKNRYDIAEDVQPLGEVESYGVAGTASQELGFATLTSITGYEKSRFRLQFDGDVSNLNLVALDITQRDRQFSQEVQLSSKPSSPIKWVLGAFYFDASDKFDPNTVGIGPALGGPVFLSTYARLTTKSLAGYGQVTAPIFKDTNLTLGFRYTNEKKGIDNIRVDTVAGGALIASTPSAPQNTTYNTPTWRASIDHHFAPDVMMYVSYNRGFKSGGYNGQFPTDAPYKPERIDAYEVGLKAEIFDRRLQINTSGFYYDYTNIQVAKYVGNQQSFYNGAAAKVYGLDVDFDARITPRFSLSGGITLLHDRFTSFPNAIIGVQTPFGVTNTVGSAKGNRLPLTPDFTSTITALYTVPVPIGKLVADISYTYSDGYFSQPDNVLHQPSYNLLSAGLTLALKNNLSVRVWGRNLLDTSVFTTLQAGTFDSNAAYQAPRTYGITMSAKF